ncbi:alpha/beta fold hydrolase [Knoellia sinensis]|uniref:alpha/beta fold hydrolase n=1 Tax=Knoellia sinensis TaxID=136100 RepID=UPI000A674EF0|nr:alpha/beta hydrolase [Knoellia sinensis]
MSTIHYSRTGTGEPVVLIHGIGHSGRVWETVPELLKDDYDVIAIDLPGHGASPKPGSGHGWSLADQCAQIEEFFDELGLDQPHVIGNSLGGAIALELGARGSVRSVTALAPAGFWSPAGLGWAAGVLTTLKALSYSPTFVIRLFGSHPVGRRLIMWPLYAHTELLTQDDFVHDALNIRRAPGFLANYIRLPFYQYRGTPQMPTAVLWGDRDAILLPTQAKVARRRLPQALHATLKGAAHCPQLDVPERVVEHALSTMRRADAGRRPAAAPSITAAS